MFKLLKLYMMVCNNELNIIYQKLKTIYYSDIFGQEINYQFSNNLIFDFDYEIFTSKEDIRDHIMVLELKIKPIKEYAQPIIIIVEGHYIISESILERNILKTIHIRSLSNLLSFLRLTLFNLTTLTLFKGVTLPLINIEELHKKYDEKLKNKK